MPTPRRMFLSLEAFKKERHLKARSGGSMVIDLALHNYDCKANKFRAQPSGRQNIWEPYAGLCSCFSSCDARRKASFYWRGKINSEAMSVPKRSKQKRYTCSSACWLPGQPTHGGESWPQQKHSDLIHDHRQPPSEGRCPPPMSQLCWKANLEESWCSSCDEYKNLPDIALRILNHKRKKPESNLLTCKFLNYPL